MRIATSQDQPRSHNKNLQLQNTTQSSPTPHPHIKKFKDFVVVSQSHCEHGQAGYRTGGSFHIQNLNDQAMG